MMKTTIMRRIACAMAAAALACGLGACAGQQTDGQQAETQQEAAATTAPADGTYEIEVETDSSMFRADSCKLTVKDGACTAELVLPGEGFSKLYFGSAEDAAKASDTDVYAYHLNDAGKYCFDIPVTELDKEIQVAAFGQRRDKWYDHTITFHAPTAAATSDAA